MRGVQRRGNTACGLAVTTAGSITLTHADISRYFMTIPEAAQLVSTGMKQ